MGKLDRCKLSSSIKPISVGAALLLTVWLTYLIFSISETYAKCCINFNPEANIQNDTDVSEKININLKPKMAKNELSSSEGGRDGAFRV